jgi:hypothetical protein
MCEQLYNELAIYPDELSCHKMAPSSGTLRESFAFSALLLQSNVTETISKQRTKQETEADSCC